MTTDQRPEATSELRVNTNQPSPFSFKHKAARLLWGIVQGTVFRWIPVPFHGPRRALLKLFGARIHGTARVYPTVKVWAPWNLEMAADSCIGPSTICYNVDTIALERGALVSQNCHLCSASHDYRDPAFRLIHAPIRLQPGCWVCADVFVAMGVTIGENAVVGARSVVTRSMPANMVCSGFPCAPLKPRFPVQDESKNPGTGLA